MSIDLKYLENEKKTLTNDFENTKLKIKETENALAQLKGNLNAVYGAIQQNDKMIKLLRFKWPANEHDSYEIPSIKHPSPHITYIKLFISIFFDAIAIPTPFAIPCPSGPVVVSIPEFGWYSG